MRKIIFFTKSVSILGGKEKVLINLANYLAENACAVEIITYDGSTRSAFPINSEIKINTIPLNFINYTHKVLAQLAHFFKDIKNYKALRDKTYNADYLVTTDQIVTTVAYYAFKNQSRKIIVWEHLPHVIYTSRIWLFFIKRVFPKIKLVVTLNKEEAAYYKSLSCNTETVPNAVTQGVQLTLRTDAPVVWAGAITRQKGIDDVIKLGMLLKKNGVDKQVHVYGAGEDKDYFMQAVAGNALENTLVYKGAVSDSAVIYKNAVALLVTSKLESFSMVIVEAFSFGVPAISYNCPTGPRNIITDNETGFLIEPGDVEGLYNCVVKLSGQPQLLKEMGANAYQASGQYTAEKIYPRWNKIFI